MNTTQQTQPLILVVDDEPALLGEVASVLTAAGFTCHCCTTADMAIAKAKTAPHVPELRWSALLGRKVAKTKAGIKKPASKRVVKARVAKAVGTVTKKESKLAEDEEASAAAAEPMGSVAAAVSRDQESSEAQMKESVLPKTATEEEKSKADRH